MLKIQKSKTVSDFFAASFSKTEFKKSVDNAVECF